jgi:hypothetical protein
MGQRTGDQPGMPRIPGYELLRVIGRGGMGEVYVAKQLALGRLVAIKCLSSEFGSSTSEPFLRFRREAELMARVNQPNVLSAFDFGTSEGRPYLVMEYVEGGDLRRLMKPGEPMVMDRAMAILRSVAEALQCLHRHEVLHRDLKPENVLLSAEGHPKVADFGIAVLRTGVGESTCTQLGLGTPGYVSPEQRYGLNVGEPADQYSLAALAYEMLTGRAPLGVIRPASRLNPELGPAIDSVLMRGLAEDPDDRFKSVGAFVEALEGAARPQSGVKRRLNARGALAATLIAVTAAIGFATWRSRVPDDPARPGVLVVRPIPKLDGPDAPQKVAALVQDSRSPRERDSLEELIAAQLEQRAFRIWERKQKPDGSAKDDWLEASQELLGHSALRKAILDEIEKRAYFIWIDNGQPDGTALVDWVTAKQEFLASAGFTEAIKGVIRERAHRMWIMEGQPVGRQENHWHEARRQLITDGTLMPREIENSLRMRLRFVAGDPAHSRPPVYLGVTEVTVGEFRKFVEATGHCALGPPVEEEDAGVNWIEASGSSGPSPDTHPAAGVSWADAEAFGTWLGVIEGAVYRLPAEYDWLAACADEAVDPMVLANCEWLRENSDDHAHAVATKPPNSRGFHDLGGNLSEWCLGACTGGGADRPILGGNWQTRTREARADWRQCEGADYRSPTVGFRVCREVRAELGAEPLSIAEGRR